MSCSRAAASPSGSAGRWPSTTWTSTCARARCTRSSARTAPARARWSRSSTATTGPTRARCRSTGSACASARVRDAEHAGVAMIPQELDLFGELSVAENLVVGRERPRTSWGGVDWAAMRAAARERFEALGVELDSDDAGQAALDRQPAARRDRPRAGRRRARGDHGRADLVALGRGGAAAVRRHRRPHASAASASSTSRTAWTRSSSSPTASPSCATARHVETQGRLRAGPATRWCG